MHARHFPNTKCLTDAAGISTTSCWKGRNKLGSYGFFANPAPSLVPSLLPVLRSFRKNSECGAIDCRFVIADFRVLNSCKLEEMTISEDPIQEMQHLDIAGGKKSEKSWEEMLQREFPHHRKGVARLNNGSFGSCPASVLVVQAAWQKLWLEQPDEFYFGPLEKGLKASREAIASVIRASSAEQIVLVDNATTAAAIIAQDTAWGFIEKRYNPGDAILMLNCSYGAVKKCFQAYAVRAGARIIEAEISLPVLNTQQILDSFSKVLNEARQNSTTIRLAVIDHITSMPSVVLPAKQLVDLCYKSGVQQVFVDGAHSIGNIGINVEEIGADFYTSNLHKWLFTPSSAAFLHVKPQHLERLHHPLVSHNLGQGLWSECAWVGTRDYSALLAIPSAIAFIQRELGGLETVIAFNHRRAMEMAQMLASAWGTECATGAPELASSMVMVGLPDELGIWTEEDALEMRTRLRRGYDVEVPVCFQDRFRGENKGKGFVRVSHQVYNRVEEYNRLRDAVLELVRK